MVDMSASFDTLHPRIANGMFTDKEHSAPEMSLGSGASGHVTFTDLVEQRGWSSGLARLHAVGSFQRYDLDDIRHTERTAAFRADRDYERAGNKVAFIRTELLERGWTPNLITKYLGEPASTYGTSVPGNDMYVWHGRDVIAAEKDPEFVRQQKISATRAATKSQRGQDRARAVDAAAEEAASALSIDLPFEDMDEIERAALDWHNEQEDDPDYVTHDLSDVPQTTIDEWVQEYALHECSDYRKIRLQLVASSQDPKLIAERFDAHAQQAAAPKIEQALAALR